MDNGQGPRRRPDRNTFTTRSGNSIRVNRSFSDRRRARKDAQARSRAARLSGLPAERWKRVLYRLHPKRLAAYWFSREGGIMALKLVGVGIVVIFLFLVGMFAYFRKDLPNITDVSGNNLPGSISYYDRTGQTLLWQDYDAVKRIPVGGSAISDNMKNATIAIEDKDFYHEGAFNVRGIARAGTHDLFGGGGGLQGGSTITQQLVKLNENWTGDRTIARKIKEVILAVELEREYSKADILTGYLNIAPYGGIEYGAESAARDYFHSSATKLTLAQAAMLAAIPQSPDYYSPYSDNFNKQALLNRQHYILDQMVDQHLISSDQAAAAKQTDVIVSKTAGTSDKIAQVYPLPTKYGSIKAPYFVLAAKKELEDRYGSQTVQRGGWKITTTLNMDLQNLADSLVQKNRPNIERNGADQEAFAAEDVKTGQMVALVGGVDFFDDSIDGQINRAQSNIPPGSSFKPYDYTSLINSSQNVGAGSVLYDVKQKLPGYDNTCDHNPYLKNAAPCPPGTSPALYDYDGKFPGPLTLRYALAGSRNVPAVKAMLTAGVDKTISTAEAMMGNPHGYNCYYDSALTKTAPCYSSSAIGDGAFLHLDDHVNGLGTLAREGNAIPKTYIMKIVDASGKTIDQWSQPKGKQVVRQDAAYIVDSILSDPNASYLPYGYKFQHYNGWHFAVKTGTTNNNFDGLMTSWSTQYAAAVWVGYHTRNKALTAGSMELVTEPVTRGWMQGAHDKLHMTPVDWVKPSGIKTLPAFVVRNHVGVGSVEPSPSTDLFPSWYTQKSTSSSAVIDKVSGKLATNCTPDLAKQTVGGGNANAFSVDQYVNGDNKNTTSNYNTVGNDDVHNCGDQKPAVNLTVAGHDGQPTDTCTHEGCTITVTVSQGTHNLSGGSVSGSSQVKLSVNNNVISTFNFNGDGTQTFSYNYIPDNTGSAAISAQAIDSVLYDATANSTVSTQSDGSNSNNSNSTPGPFSQ